MDQKSRKPADEAGKDGGSGSGAPGRVDVLGRPFPEAPGTVPEPKEKGWDEEPPDPYEGLEKTSPFKGRPAGKAPQPSENMDDLSDSEAPGQPARRASLPEDDES